MSDPEEKTGPEDATPEVPLDQTEPEMELMQKSLDPSVGLEQAEQVIRELRASQEAADPKADKED